MHTSGYTHLNASFQGSTTTTKALIADRLSHNMILSWQDCIKLRIVPMTFPLSTHLGQVAEIHNKAEAIRDKQIRDHLGDISHNKILTDPTKINLRDTKITQYRASTTRQIPLRYQAQADAYINKLIDQGIITKVSQPTPWCCHIFRP